MERLFDRAKVGEITGEEADAEAIRLGLGSLSRRPGPDEFRPEAEPRWTLPMAVAWIAYLDLEEVREWSAPYRAECCDWHWQRWRRGFDGPVYEGWHLEQRSKPTLALLSVSSAFDRAEGARQLTMTIREAREALWMALQEGFFVASGIDTESERRVEIPALDWHELVPIERRGEADEVRCGPMGRGYRDILLPSNALRGFWRRPAENVERLPPTMRPEGDGFMPLYCAAQWIATERGALDFPPNDPPRWRAAYAELLAAITSEKVRVVGLRSGEREVIGGHIFAGIQVDYPFQESELDLTVGSELYLRSYPYLDDEHWRGGFDDALIQKREDKWTRLMVDRAAVRLLWPDKLKKSTLLTGALPLSMSPTGDGYMPLYCAAEWIATRGGKVDFEISDEQHWPAAFTALLAAIASEKVRVTGVQDHLREPVPAAVFSDLRVFYPSGNSNDSFLGTGAPFLQSWPYDEEDWRAGDSDKITSQYEDQWTALMVEKGDVRRAWPFDKSGVPKSGVPGRPTSSHLLLAEMTRRAGDGLLDGSLAAESRHLSNWLADNHPEMPQAKPKAVQEAIRARYWELRPRK